MRLIQTNGEGVCEVAWMWLPTFIGQHRSLMQKLQQELSARFTGMEPTEEVLDQIHAWIIDWVSSAYKIPGLREYLTAVSAVEVT